MLATKPIAENDYYTQFQTALYIAVEELGVKQAFLAEACGISPGYLSKLRGWNRHPESRELIRRPHMTNTNFKAYAMPLLGVLREHPQAVHFESGCFRQQIAETLKEWGELALAEPVATGKLFRTNTVLPELDELEFPAEGELSIEWNFDFERDPGALKKAMSILQKLGDNANSKVVIQVKLQSPQSPAKHFKSMPPLNEKRASGMNNGYNDSIYLPVPTNDDHNPFFHLSLDYFSRNRSQTDAFEHITVNDHKNNRLMEQFCDLSHWNLLTKTDDFQFDPAQNQFSGGGMHQHLHSQHVYGRQPFIIHAELEFQQYSRETENPGETSNAGFIFGWKHIQRETTYYHLLLTGKKMLLERIGAHGGNAYDDFEHLDEGVDFQVEDGVAYNFLLRFKPESLDVVVNHQHVYHVKLPNDVVGHVGLRPWRSKMACRFFEVRELSER